MPQIQTERLKMIPFSLDRVKATIQGREELARLSGYSVNPAWPQVDFEEILPWLAGLMEKDPTFSDWMGLIVHTADSMVIGDMGFKGAPDEHGAVEVGYSVVPDYQGKGYATEMLRGMIEFAFAQPGVQKVLAECEETNIGSIRVLEKAGLRQIGQDGTLLKWEVLKAE
ncbi:MAG: GNAT family N-acetyltransferase [Tumebacillaceae bacterium]